MRSLARCRWGLLAATLIVASSCNPMSDSSRNAAGQQIQFGSVSPSGAWRLGDAVADGALWVEPQDDPGGRKQRLALPRLSDLKFVGWGPDDLGGSDVIWVYSADVGPLLYVVSDAGIERVPCPPVVRAPTDWPGEQRIPCGAGWRLG